MTQGEFDGDDIYIWLSEKEIIKLGQLEIRDRKLVYYSLDVLLRTKEKKNLRAIIKHEDFDDFGTGIKVERMDYGFSIKMNDKSYWKLFNESMCGTRYGDNKLIISLEDN